MTSLWLFITVLLPKFWRETWTVAEQSNMYTDMHVYCRGRQVDHG